MDWDDLRYILAVYDNGSALAAAQKFGVNASTVQRRIIKFEKENNVHLFERLPSGYRPTAECTSLVKTSRKIDESVARLRRDIFGKDLRLEGCLTITSTDAVFTSVVARHLAEFHRKHADITIDLRLTSVRLNLIQQDADIAIRPTFDPHENLVGQRVADLHFGVYASSDVIASLPLNPTLEELARQKWLGSGQGFSGSTSHNWMQQHIPEKSCRIEIDTFQSMAACAVQSMGLALLPCIVGDPISQLQRLQIPWFELSSPVWVLTHPEIRNAARVRAFMNFITKALRNERAVLEGRVSSTPQ